MDVRITRYKQDKCFSERELDSMKMKDNNVMNTQKNGHGLLTGWDIFNERNDIRSVYKHPEVTAIYYRFEQEI